MFSESGIFQGVRWHRAKPPLRPSDENISKYATIPEIHAAVATIADMAEWYHKAPLHSREELFAHLIEFFGNYDTIRTNQVEQLKADLIEAMKYSVRPMQSGPTEESPDRENSTLL